MTGGMSRREQREAVAGIILGTLYEDGGRWTLDEIEDHVLRHYHKRLALGTVGRVLLDLAAAGRVVEIAGDQAGDPPRYCAPAHPNGC